MAEACRQIGVTDQTYYRWRKEYGGVRTDLARAYGRYGYRRITMMLRDEGWNVNHKRIERLWRLEGLKVPVKQPKRRRLWFSDGSCVRLRPQHRDHVWSYDFVFSRTHDGRPIRMLTMIDEFTRECLAIDVSRRLTSEDVLERLSDLFIHRGPPEYIRSDNGPEFTALQLRVRPAVRTASHSPGRDRHGDRSGHKEPTDSSEDRGSRDAGGSPSRAAPVLKLPLPERVPPRRVHADPHARMTLQRPCCQGHDNSTLRRLIRRERGLFAVPPCFHQITRKLCPNRRRMKHPG